MLLSLGRSVKKNQFLFLNKNYSYKHLRFKLGVLTEFTCDATVFPT